MLYNIFVHYFTHKPCICAFYRYLCSKIINMITWKRLKRIGDFKKDVLAYQEGNDDIIQSLLDEITEIKRRVKRLEHTHPNKKLLRNG